MPKSSTSLPPIHPTGPSTHPQTPATPRTSTRPSPRLRDLSHLRDASPNCTKNAFSSSISTVAREYAENEFHETQTVRDETISQIPSTWSRFTKSARGKIESSPTMTPSQEQPHQRHGASLRQSWMDPVTQQLLPLSTLDQIYNKSVVQSASNLASALHILYKRGSSGSGLSSPPPKSQTNGVDNISHVETFLSSMPPTILPHRYAALELTQFIQPSDDLSSISINQKKKQYERVLFPSTHPSGRAEVVMLAKTLKDMLQEASSAISQRDQIIGEGSFIQEKGYLDIVINSIQTEANIWDIILSEIVRQVHVHCGERGLLLEQVRVRFIELLSLSLRCLSKLSEQYSDPRGFHRPSGPQDREANEGRDHISSELQDIHQLDQIQIDDLKEKLHKAESENWILKERVDYLEDRLATMIIQLNSRQDLDSPDEFSSDGRQSAFQLQAQQNLDKRKESFRKLSVYSAKSLKPGTEEIVGRDSSVKYDPSADLRVVQKVSDAAIKLDNHLLTYYDPEPKKTYKSFTEMVSTVARRRRSSIARPIIPVIMTTKAEGDVSDDSGSSGEEFTDDLSEVGLKLREVKRRLRRLVRSQEKLMAMEEGIGQEAQECSPMFQSNSTEDELNSQTMRALKLRTTWLKGKLRKTQNDYEQMCKDYHESNLKISRLNGQLQKLKETSVIPKLSREIYMWKTKYETLRSHLENDTENMASIVKMIEAAARSASLVPDKSFWGFLEDSEPEDDIPIERAQKKFNTETYEGSKVAASLENEYWASPPSSPAESPSLQINTNSTDEGVSQLPSPSVNRGRLVREFSDLEMKFSQTSSASRSRFSVSLGGFDVAIVDETELPTITEDDNAVEEPMPIENLVLEYTLPAADQQARLGDIDPKKWKPYCHKAQTDLRLWEPVQIEFTEFSGRIQAMFDTIIDRVSLSGANEKLEDPSAEASTQKNDLVSIIMLYLFGVYSKESLTKKQGTRDDLPPILNDYHKLILMPEKRPLTWVYAFIHNIYAVKIAIDLKHNMHNHGWRMPDYVYFYLRSTMKGKSHRWATISLLSNIIAYREEDVYVESFARFLEESWGFDVLDAYIRSCHLVRELKVCSNGNSGIKQSSTESNCIDVRLTSAIVRLAMNKYELSDVEKLTLEMQEIAMASSNKKRIGADQKLVIDTDIFLFTLCNFAFQQVLEYKTHRTFMKNHIAFELCSRNASIFVMFPSNS
eukprot:TRINITY_DN7300_c0_g1_i3.p1 TRINITY_DN7300_c0_g1~~TRINITY_DN7300_c0_g1_i3.p1  ORF type:complete len:1208 (+),score=253.33 TRINITY_DN7300_c0_g1_i3:38-3661(+)